jgi:tRNA (mo5U34)-methyltransferase
MLQPMDEPSATAAQHHNGEDGPAALGEWFHNLHLPGGIETAPQHPLGDFPNVKWQRVKRCVPDDLRGWRILDIGCNAGFYSFELAKRGADVLGVDFDRRYLDQARWAADRLELQEAPRFIEMSVYQLHQLDGQFDLIWFMGVAYHLRHPLLALDIARSLAGGYMMFQTMSYPDDAHLDVPEDFPLTDRSRIAAPGWPKLGFVEHRLAGDPTNWWVANDACARAMLRSSGFEILDVPEHETYWCRGADTRVDEAVRSELRSVMQARVP